MNTKLWQVNRLKTWLKSTGNYVLFVFFIITVVVLTVIIIDKHIYSKQPAQIQQPQIVFDHESALKRVDNLEKIIEKQAYQIQRLETDNETLTSANRQLEKRLQFHTDTLKRICEYIVVITVDKKILPRQCLSDYNWRREEGL